MSAAKAYGSGTCKLEPNLVEAWKEELRELLHGRAEEVVLKEKIEFKSPLRASLWEAWQRMAADPEKYIAVWARHGDERGDTNKWRVLQGDGRHAGTSRGGSPGCRVEVGFQKLFVCGGRPGRSLLGAGPLLLHKGFAKRMAKSDAQHRFGTGTVSKLALIVKEKGDGTIKRRIIIDLLCSGGNDRARVPCSDFTESARRLWKVKNVRLQEKVRQQVLLLGPDPVHSSDLRPGARFRRLILHCSSQNVVLPGDKCRTLKARAR